MAEVKIKLVVEGLATTEATYSIKNAPDEVAADIDLSLGKLDVDKLPKPGKNTAHITLIANGKKLVDADMGINQIAVIEKKLVKALDKLIDKHSD